jgi:hypothetical protein
MTSEVSCLCSVYSAGFVSGQNKHQLTTRKSTLLNVCTFGQHATLPGLTVWCNNWKCWWCSLHNLGYVVGILLTLCYTFRPSCSRVFGDWDLCLIYTYIHTWYYFQFNTLRTGDADLRLYAYKQFKYPVPNVLRCLFRHIFPNRKLGHVINLRYYFSLFRSLENIILIAEQQVILLKEQ